MSGIHRLGIALIGLSLWAITAAPHTGAITEFTMASILLMSAGIASLTMPTKSGS